MRFRLGLDQLGRGLRPQLERDDLAQARAKRQAADEAREAAELEVLRRKEAAEAPWVELEEFARLHMAHSDLTLSERVFWNEENSTLADRVLLWLTCRDCYARVDRWVVPAMPARPADFQERVEQIRDAMRMVERTGRRPPWAYEEVQALQRRIDADAFAARHREHGSVAVAEEWVTHPVPVPGGTVDELDGVNLSLRCPRCDDTLSWWAETEEEAKRILAELRAVES